MSSFGESFGFPFFEGAGSATLAPYTFPVALGQFTYNLDLTQPFGVELIPYIRQQADQSEVPGEHSLSPNGLWRRSADSWHLGAGQTHYDRENSSPYRFDASTGMFVWNKWKLSLLEDTDEKLTDASTNLLMAVAGTDLYLLRGAELARCTNIDVDTPTFTDLTGTNPTNEATSIVSNGNHVWTAHGTQGIWRTTRGTTAWAGAAHITGTVELLGWARGRLLAANNNIVYDVTTLGHSAGGALPTPLFTHDNSDFQWTAFAEGRNAVYMAGYSGDKSLIYKATIKSDGTGLDAPTVAGELPDGEQIESLYGYLGPFFFIGIGGLPGWRFALVNQNGDLQIGARVETPSPVLCFEGQENFVWFGWGSYSTTPLLTGLGRINIQEFGDPDALVPAYASDLMCTEDGNIKSIVTFQGIRVFTVHTDGVFATHHLRNLVPSGTLDTGEITFKINEDKIGLYFDVTHLVHMGGHHNLSVSVESGPFISLGEHEEHLIPFVVGEIRARVFEFRIGLTRDAVDLTAGQTLTSWLFRAQPVPAITKVWKLPLLISPTVSDLDGNPHPMDPWIVFADIVDMATSKSIQQLHVNGAADSVVVEDYQLIFNHLVNDDQGQRSFNGTANVVCKSILEAI